MLKRLHFTPLHLSVRENHEFLHCGQHFALLKAYPDDGWGLLTPPTIMLPLNFSLDSIHPSILHLLIDTCGCRGAGVDPSWHWAKAGYTMDKLPGHVRADKEEKQPHIRNLNEFEEWPGGRKPMYSANSTQQGPGPESNLLLFGDSTNHGTTAIYLSLWEDSLTKHKNTSGLANLVESRGTQWVPAVSHSIFCRGLSEYNGLIFSTINKMLKAAAIVRLLL